GREPLGLLCQVERLREVLPIFGVDPREVHQRQGIVRVGHQCPTVGGDGLVDLLVGEIEVPGFPVCLVQRGGQLAGPQIGFEGAGSVTLGEVVVTCIEVGGAGGGGG